MSITSYDSLNNLREFSFIAGSDKLLTFTCYADDGFSPLNISNGSASWALCPYGQFDYPVIRKTGTITSTNVFTVTLSSSDTMNLSGKYIQQVTVLDSEGHTFTPGQGSVVILPVVTGMLFFPL
jgi:hypothetical protein